MPLNAQCKRFQLDYSLKTCEELFQQGEKIKGKPLQRSVNSSLASAESLWIYPAITYFSGEVPHGLENMHENLTPIWCFKLANMVDRMHVCTATGGDWASTVLDNRRDAVRSWIAQAYAFGNIFMVPYHVWCYSPSKGTHWYDTDEDDYAFLYRFIQENKVLFDGYKMQAPVALLYDFKQHMDAKYEQKRVAEWLAENGIQFDLAAVNAEEIKIKFDKKKLESYKLIIAPEPLGLKGEDKKAATGWAAKGKLILMDPELDFSNQTLEKLKEYRIEVSNRAKVLATAQTIPGKAETPVVIHIVNKNYNYKQNKLHKQKNIKISFHESLFDRSLSNKAILYTPIQGDGKSLGATEKQAITLSKKNGIINVTIPSLEIWGVLKIE